MTKASKLYQQLKGSRASLRFADLQLVVEAFGFVLRRTRGSHHVYRHPEVPEQLNLQPDGRNAKPYQVDQFLLIVERFNLKLDD